jgi:hypothetical protein
MQPTITTIDFSKPTFGILKSRRDNYDRSHEINWEQYWNPDAENAFREQLSKLGPNNTIHGANDNRLFREILQANNLYSIPSKSRGLYSFLCEKGILEPCNRDGSQYKQCFIFDPIKGKTTKTLIHWYKPKRVFSYSQPITPNAQAVEWQISKSPDSRQTLVIDPEIEAGLFLQSLLGKRTRDEEECESKKNPKIQDLETEIKALQAENKALKEKISTHEVVHTKLLELFKPI